MKKTAYLLVVIAAIHSFSLFVSGQKPCLTEGNLTKIQRQLEAGKSPAVNQQFRTEILEMRNASAFNELFGVDKAKKVNEMAIMFTIWRLKPMPPPEEWKKMDPSKFADELKEIFLTIGGDNVAGTARAKFYDRKLENLEEKTSELMCRAIDQYGWPTVSLVGSDGASAAAFLLKKLPEIVREEKFLGIIGMALKKDEMARDNNTAALFDRILVRNGKGQVFGTQATVTDEMIAVYPLDNVRLTDTWRAQFGMMPLDQNLNRLEVFYRMTSVLMPPIFQIPAGPKSSTTTGALPAAAAKKDDDDMITVDTNLVNLDLMMLDPADKFRGELKLSDFAVYENGVKQEVSFFSAAEAPFDLVLLLDVSGSTAGKLELLRESTANFINYKRPDDRLAIMTFAGEAKVVSPFTANKEELLAKAKTIRGYGGSNVWGALKHTLALFDKKEAGRRKAVVMMSDGADNALMFPIAPPYNSFAGVLETVRQSGIPIFPIYLDTEGDAIPVFKTKEALQKAVEEGVPENAKTESPSRTLQYLRSYYYARKTLALLAEESGGHYYKAARLRDLDRVYRQVLNDLGKVYTIGYAPTNEKRDGTWRTVKVEVKGHPEISVFTKPGYYAN